MSRTATSVQSDQARRLLRRSAVRSEIYYGLVLASWDPIAIHRRSEQFSQPAFIHQIRSAASALLQDD